MMASCVCCYEMMIIYILSTLLLAYSNMLRYHDVPGIGEENEQGVYYVEYKVEVVALHASVFFFYQRIIHLIT